MSDPSELEPLPFVEADPPGETTGLVVWLHGLGADGHDFEPILPELPLAELGLRVVLPHAPSQPVSINAGFVMPAWYDILPGPLADRHDEAGIRRSAARVEALLERERARLGLPASRCVVAGFSQGGAVALHLGLRQQEALGGLVALSTYLVLPEAAEVEATPASLETPVFQAHGSEDPVVPLERGQAACDWLERRGYRVEWRGYPMEHAVCPAEVEALGEWFRRTLATG